MLTCRKVYADIPVAHRQHRHDGHCAFIHGHNWTFAFTFGCRETDACGFVVDFGKLGYIRDWIRDHLDHACLFNADDPLRETLVGAAPEAWKAVVLPDVSSEGLAQYLFAQIDPRVRAQTGGRAYLAQVEVWEDAKNAAVFSPERP